VNIHLAKTTPEQSVRGSDAALCQITLTTCSFSITTSITLRFRPLASAMLRRRASATIYIYALGAGEFTPRQLNDRHCRDSNLLPAGGGCGVLLRRRKSGCDDRDRLRFGGSSRRNSFTGIALSGVGGGGLTMPPTYPASSVRFQLQSLG